MNKLNEVPDRLLNKLPFKNLFHYYDEDDTFFNNMRICQYCLLKFKNESMPSTCILNELQFESVPQCIAQLNEFEKLFIQRAKAFQVFARMDTVMGGHNRKRPSSDVIKKIKGRVFHLPLPLENNLKKLPNPQSAILKDQDLTVIVRGTPSNKRNIWQSLIDIRKIYGALK